MAALAEPVIEFAVTRLLAALGTGAVVVGGVDLAKTRAQEAQDAKATPLTKADATTRKKKCDECPPDKGVFKPRNTAGWSATSIAYQVRICGLPVGPGVITEWAFGGVDFDGFDSGQCLLKEAKAKYDQFFDLYGGVEEWWLNGEDKLIAEFMRQAAVAEPRPPTRLRWHFMEPVSYRHFSKIFAAAYPDVEVVFEQ